MRMVLDAWSVHQRCGSSFNEVTTDGWVHDHIHYHCSVFCIICGISTYENTCGIAQNDVCVLSLLTNTNRKHGDVASRTGLLSCVNINVANRLPSLTLPIYRGVK